MSRQEHRYGSLEAALREHHLPLENDPQIRHFITRLGLTEFIQKSSYIVAARPSGSQGRALHIHYGYTNGFSSQDEARMAAFGIAEPWKSKRGWGVTHRENKLRSGNRSSSKMRGTRARRESCSVHHIQLPASGRCDDCS